MRPPAGVAAAQAVDWERGGMLSRTVGVFHTHPNLPEEGYSPLPSPSDENFTENYAKVPHLVLTHDGAEWIDP